MSWKPVRLDELKIKDVIRADEGFTCMAPGKLYVYQNDKGFYVHCSCSSRKHYLDRQLRDDGTLEGFSREASS